MTYKDELLEKLRRNTREQYPMPDTPEGLTHIRTLNPWGVAHAMPNFAKESFQTMWKKGKLKEQ